MARGEIEAELIVGRLRDADIDARIVRDGKQSPGAWMYVGHDPFEPMAVMVPEGDAEAAREVLELEAPEAIPQNDDLRTRPTFRVVLVAVVALVLVAALLQAELNDVLPFLGEP